MEQNNFLKFNLYFLSLALLFVFIIIMTAELPKTLIDISSAIWWRNLVKINIVAVFSFFILFYCLFSYKYFEFKINGTPDIPFEIKKIESINYEHLTFLATYVVPLISFDFSSIRQLIVFIFLLVVMGVMYIKTDLFYANPSLALLGFKIYRVDVDSKNGVKENIILISRESLSGGDFVAHVLLDERIFYARKTQ